MKCPKCSYLGFETGDRCKNCGYDFSLLAASPESPDPDLNVQLPDDIHAGADASWMDRLHTGVEEVAEAHEMPEPVLDSSTATIDPPVVPNTDASFPLFENRGDDFEDEPLIKLPAAPRAPLAVRRTPEQPHLRPSNRTVRPSNSPLSLEFAEDPSSAVAVVDFVETYEPVETRRQVETGPTVSSLGRRAAAGLTDHAILFGVDLIVLYSTLRMAGLTMGDWLLLPPAPMLGFLVLLKLSYFGAFTAACGQTIGKMAVRIRVVADDAPLDPSRAIRRTIMSGLSLLALGAGFIPALLDPEHRALHDRLAHTRVVELPSA